MRALAPEKPITLNTLTVSARLRRRRVVDVVRGIYGGGWWRRRTRAQLKIMLCVCV